VGNILVCPCAFCLRRAQLFSVKLVVCCCVYLNMQPIVDNSRSESNWFNWLKIGLAEESEVFFLFVIRHFAWPRTHNKTLQVYREQHWAPYTLMWPLDGIPNKCSKYLWSPNPKRIKCRMTNRKKTSLSSARPIFSQLNQLLSDLELSTIGCMFKYTQQQTNLQCLVVCPWPSKSR
jgi:hypothetical protein